MNPVKYLKNYLSNILIHYKESTCEKVASKNRGFRDLLKKRKSIFILLFFIIFLIAFGISKSFLLITSLIVSSPFIVIFWSSFGEQIRKIFKYKNN